MPSHFSEAIVEKINRTLLSLAYSIIAAYIFYFVTVVVPLWIQIGKSKRILSYEVYFFLEDLYILINQILYVYKIDKNIDDLEEKDLLCINGTVKNHIEGGYDIQTYWNSIWHKGKKYTGLGTVIRRVLGGFVGIVVAAAAVVSAGAKRENAQNGKDNCNKLFHFSSPSVQLLR